MKYYRHYIGDYAAPDHLPSQSLALQLHAAHIPQLKLGGHRQQAGQPRAPAWLAR